MTDNELNIYESEENLQESEEFRIDNDGLADWALQRIDEEEKEYLRLKEIADEQIFAIQTKLENAEHRKESRTSFLKSKLNEYFLTVPHKTTKTTETYKLLSGTLVMKNPTQKINHDDDESLLKYIKANNLEEYVKVTEKPAWAEFKKRLQIVDGAVVDTETGDTLDMLTVEQTNPEFTIKF